jgi:hypothetical protein
LKDNRRYEWIVPPEQQGIATGPQWLLDLVIEKEAERKPGRSTAPLGKIAEALRLLSNDKSSKWQYVDNDGVVQNEYQGWDGWNTLSMSTYVGSGRSDEIFKIWDTWCAKNKIKYNERFNHDTWYYRYVTSPPDHIGIGTLFGVVSNEHPGWQSIWDEEHPDELAAWQKEHGDDDDDEGTDAVTSEAEQGVTLDSFVAYMPLHCYIYVPTREPWPGTSVNSRIKPVALRGPDGKRLRDKKGELKFISASAWLDKHHPVEQMTWAPGLPMKIHDQLVADGGWFKHKGTVCFNLYRPPTVILGDADDVAPWLEHVHRIYPADAEHILNWLAHRVQRPQEKINHALVLGGEQGIGKDTTLEPVKRAVGPWNFAEITPGMATGRFNGFLKSVILRVNEARDLGEVNRFQFYEHMKPYTASPPDVLRVDEKNLREHSVFNVCGVILTTNYKTDGIYLPADDRRNYVAWSDLKKENFTEDYWRKLWDWFDNGGDRNVAAYLATRDLSSFDAKAPPPKTDAFWAIVNANRAPEEGELADILDDLSNPNAVTIEMVSDASFGDIKLWLNDRKNRRVIPHRLERCGYISVRNDTAKDGLWKIAKRRQVVYAKSELTPAQQIEAVHQLQSRPEFCDKTEQQAC